MEDKIITLQAAYAVVSDFKNKDKKIVLVGGCFDILHKGHLFFLKHAKEQGDILMVLLESDQKIKKLKGEKRPINPQSDRAFVLSTIEFVDYIVLLPEMNDDEDYDKMISKLKPAIIATTTDDPNRSHKERQARKYNCKVVDVISLINDQSTTKLTKLLETT